MTGRASGERRRNWRQDPRGRRARILAAATREFARHGLRGARLERIAAEADVAIGTISHQFGSKQGLLLAVGDAYGRGLADAAFGTIEPEAGPEVIPAVIARIFRHVRETDGPLAAFLLSQDPLEGGPAQERNRARMIGAIEHQLRRWIDRRQIGHRDVRILAGIQFGLVESALRDCFLRGDGRNEAAYIDEVSRCVMGAVAPPPDGGRS